MKRPRPEPLLLFFTLLNGLQAALTPLSPDEAYYRLWSQQLDWGYFDHPPAVALWIRAGTLLLGDTALGIRSGFVLLNGLLVYLLWRWWQPRSGLVLLLFALPFLQVYTWTATPDALLLAASLLFLRQYQQFLARSSAGSVLLLGVSMALLLYVKYHGVLLILLIWASNPRLALKSKAWLAVVFGLFLYAPHLNWQWAHGFQTLTYHLSARSPEPYQLRHTLEFVLNQLLLFHPVLLLPAARRIFQLKAISPFERAMQFVLVGFPLFFLCMTAKGYSEPHWTYIAVLPFLYFYIQRFSDIIDQKWVKHTLWASAALLLTLRIFIAFAPAGLPLETQRYTAGAKAALQIADGHPLVWANTYQHAALSAFYGKQYHPVVLAYNRKSRPNYLTLQEAALDTLQGKKVCIVAPFPFWQARKLQVPDYPDWQLECLCVDSFDFLNRIRIDLLEPLAFDTLANFSIKIENPYPFEVKIGPKAHFIAMAAYRGGWLQEYKALPLPETSIAAGTTRVYRDLKIPAELLQKMPDALFFCVAGKHEPFPLNSPEILTTGGR